uniref:Apple domain-containing protein n=1 Tax=Acrobeloides nanus TaxID=290746 RepID=A0A914BYM8_9BILA
MFSRRLVQNCRENTFLKCQDFCPLVHVFALLFVGLFAGGLLTIISIAASKPHLLFGSETECKIEALPLNQNITETFNAYQVILEESRDASLKIEATTEDLLLLDFETGEEHIKNLEHELDTCKKDLKEKKFEEKCTHEANADIIGHDIALKYGSIEDCCAFCHATPNCKGYAWENWEIEGGRCWLKSVNGPIVHNKNGVHAGILNRFNIPYKTFTNEELTNLISYQGAGVNSTISVAIVNYLQKALVLYSTDRERVRVAICGHVVDNLKEKFGGYWGCAMGNFGSRVHAHAYIYLKFNLDQGEIVEVFFEKP